MSTNSLSCLLSFSVFVNIIAGKCSKGDFPTNYSEEKKNAVIKCGWKICNTMYHGDDIFTQKHYH